MEAIMVLDIGYQDWFYNSIFNQEKTYNAYIASLINNDENEDHIIGYIMLESHRNDNSSYIQGLFVEKEYRNIGIAKRLIEEAEKYSKGLGSRYMEADITPNLFSFYNKLGYFVTKAISPSKIRIQKDLEKYKERNNFIESLKKKTKKLKKLGNQGHGDNQHKNGRHSPKGEKEPADD